jgi:uncharacterized protein YndB with AHSA1/START domain
MAYAQLNFQGNAEGTLPASGSTSLDIAASVQIEAEARRVLYALATPEYMEAWLHLPNVERVECHPEQRSYDRFRIDMICSGKCQESIFGACLLSRPNRITYLWESNQASGLVKSLVEIHLYSSLSYCTVKLKHSGLPSQQDREWYSRMWVRSLDKLSRVIGGIGVAPTNRETNATVRNQAPSGELCFSHCD